MEMQHVIWLAFILAFLPALAVLIKKKPWFRALFGIAVIIGVLQLIVFFVIR